MAGSTKTQPTLLKRIQDGEDALAWRDFFDRYWRLIYALAKHRGCSDHTAEEIVQEAFLQAWNQAERYDPNQGPFLPVHINFKTFCSPQTTNLAFVPFIGQCRKQFDDWKFFTIHGFCFMAL